MDQRVLNRLTTDATGSAEERVANSEDSGDYRVFMMDGDLVLRAFSVWLCIALLEIAQGILRVWCLNRRLGDKRARQVGVFSGRLPILVITWMVFPWLKAENLHEQLQVGGLWLACMLGLDLFFGRVVFRMSWKRIRADFDLRRGGFLGLGMVFLFLAPVLVGRFCEVD